MSKYKKAYEEAGTVKGAARLLGCAPKTVRRNGQKGGWLKPPAAPMLEPIDGQVLAGVSTMVRTPDGLPQWVKTHADTAKKLAAFERAVESICAGIDPIEPTALPDSTEDDLLFAIPIGDSHVGMLSWAIETGADWDLTIAEKAIVSSVCSVIDRAPACSVCRLVQLGDFFHSDNQSNQTARSGHPLDVDSRWARVLEVGMRILIRITDYALEKFGAVEWDMVRGNHDEHTAIMAGRELAAWYRNEPRVSIDYGPSLHHYREWGANLLASHHGHTAHKQRLQGYWATHPAWSDKRRRYCYLGHEHRDREIVIGGMKFEHVNAMCPADAYAAGGAFGNAMSDDRTIRGDAWHRERGRILRIEEMVTHE